MNRESKGTFIPSLKLVKVVLVGMKGKLVLLLLKMYHSLAMRRFQVLRLSVQLTLISSKIFILIFEVKENRLMMGKPQKVWKQCWLACRNTFEPVGAGNKVSKSIKTCFHKLSSTFCLGQKYWAFCMVFPLSFSIRSREPKAANNVKTLTFLEPKKIQV